MPFPGGKRLGYWKYVAVWISLDNVATSSGSCLLMVSITCSKSFLNCLWNCGYSSGPISNALSLVRLALDIAVVTSLWTLGNRRAFCSMASRDFISKMVDPAASSTNCSESNSASRNAVSWNAVSRFVASITVATYMLPAMNPITAARTSPATNPSTTGR